MFWVQDKVTDNSERHRNFVRTLDHEMKRNTLPKSTFANNSGVSCKQNNVGGRNTTVTKSPQAPGPGDGADGIGFP